MWAIGPDDSAAMSLQLQEAATLGGGLALSAQKAYQYHAENVKAMVYGASKNGNVDAAPAASPPNDKKKRRRAFVCVHGVIEDLELDNKVHNLLNPLHEAGYEVDASFVLQRRGTWAATPTAKKKKDKSETSVVNEDDGYSGDTLFTPYREPYSFAKLVPRYRMGVYSNSKKPLPLKTIEMYANPVGDVVDGVVNPNVTRDIRWSFEKNKNKTVTMNGEISKREEIMVTQLRQRRTLMEQDPALKQLLRRTKLNPPAESTSTAFATSQDVQEYLKSHVGDNITVGSFDLYQPPLNPPLNSEYVNYMSLRDAIQYSPAAPVPGKKTKILRHVGLGPPFRRTMWRAVNNVRLLESYDRCWDAVSARMKEAGVNSDADEDVIIVRAGEDAVLHEPFDVASILRKGAATKGTIDDITVLPGETTRGHDNEQIDIVPLQIARAYFKLPYRRFYEMGLFNEKVSTMSSYLQHVYTNSSLLGGLEESEDPTQDPVNRFPGRPVQFPVPNDSMVGGPKAPVRYVFKSGASVGGTLRGSSSSISDSSDAAVTESASKTKRAFICITGQLPRLELQNKMQNLFEPMMNNGYDIDVSLVMSEGKALFQSDRVQDEKASPFHGKEEARQWLTERGISVVSDQITYVPNDNFPVNPQYWLQKVGWYTDWIIRNPTIKPESFVDYTIRNVIANFKMIEAYTRCWEDAANSGKEYDLFVRVRDDIGFNSTVAPEVYEPLLEGKSRAMVSSAFLQWSGVNDRMAFVTPEAAKCYFTLPHLKFFDGTHLNGSLKVHNTETYFKSVYHQTGCIDDDEYTPLLIPLKMHGDRFLERFQGETIEGLDYELWKPPPKKRENK